MSLQKIREYFDNRRRQSIARRDPLSAQHFIGSQFKDLLYSSDSQDRERMAVWKLISPMNSAPLCNGTWKWFAANIPLRLIDVNQPDGDLDILVHMRTNPAESGRSVYRVFEVKTSTINKFGTAKSLKTGKIDRIEGQLKKLCEFGPDQLFLLDAYIAQAGFSQFNRKPPKDLVAMIQGRMTKISHSDYGYVAFKLESIWGFNEDKTGMVPWPMNFHQAKTLERKEAFNNLVACINDFHRLTPGGYLIGYCVECKKLTKPKEWKTPSCSYCGRDLRKR